MKQIVCLVVILIILDARGQLYASEKTSLRYFRTVEASTLEHYDHFETRFRKFIQTVETSLELRRDAKSLFNALDRKLSSGGHLTSTDQQALKRDLNTYRENYIELGQFAQTYGAYGDAGVAINFPARRPSSGLEQLSKPDQRPEAQLFINPDDDLGRLMILEVKLWLAAKLLVFDNYVVVLARYLKNDELRRQFNLQTIDPKAKQFLEEVNNELLDDDRLERLLRIILLVNHILEFEKKHPDGRLAQDKDNSYLTTLIEGSYSYHRIPELTVFDSVSFDIDAAKNAIIDEVASLTDRVTYEVSEMFGNAIGLYDERKGKLFNMARDGKRQITATLQILDVLLEKTPFRLTDRFIPGYWGHVAIWVGDESDIPELKRLGVWQELPAIEAQARSKWGYKGPPFQRLIETGHGVLEALRPGVQLNTFSDFLNIDDLAVLRNSNHTDAQKKRYLLRAFAQIGKEYDFNFDVETHKRIVCSELAFVVYDDFDWPVAKSVGRYTVSPDHVAALALKEGDPFAPVLIFHDGEELPGKHNRKNLSFLLNGNYQEIMAK